MERLLCRVEAVSSTVQVKGDDGQLISPHPDWEEQTYSSIIEAFSVVDDCVYLPRIVTGKETYYSFKTNPWLPRVHKFLILV